MFSSLAHLSGESQAVRRLAASQAGVLSRPQLYALGVSRGQVRAMVRAARWRRIGTQCVGVHAGPLPEAAQLWAAVLEGGPRAFLDGDSALVAAGLRHYRTDAIRVSVPRGARIRHRGTLIDLRQTRRWSPDDLSTSPLPQARPAVAAIRAALWARSERQAALLVTMTVQQGLATTEELAVEFLRVRRDKRRALVQGLLIDLSGGVRSLGELDFIRGCRQRGIPAPDAQVLRRTDKGAYYLDFRWDCWGVVVEVDGIQHGWVQNAVADALRHNSIAIDGDRVLRLPVLGMRLCPDEFYAQVAQALRAAGCPLDESLCA